MRGLLIQFNLYFMLYMWFSFCYDRCQISILMAMMKDLPYILFSVTKELHKRQCHSYLRDTWGPDHTSSVFGHFSSSYSSMASNRWEECSDTGQSGPVTGILIPDDTFCFLIYYYYNFGFRTVFPLCLYILLVLFMGN